MIVSGQERKAPVFLGGVLLIGTEQLAGFLLVQLKEFTSDGRIGKFKIISGKLLFFQKPYLPVTAIIRPTNVVYAIHPLKISADAIQPVSQLRGNRVQVNPAALLKISELRNFEAVQEDLPAHSPGTQGGRFPVVFLKSHIVRGEVQANRCQTVQI